MIFSDVLKKIKNRRFLVPSLIVLFVIVFGGTIFGLAKTGKINIKMLADVLNLSSTSTGGWQGQYYQLDQNNQNPRLITTRNDGQYINFNWGSNSPAPGITAPNYSVRWTGNTIAPSAGSYTFYAWTDDGVRLWVNNQLVINDWRIGAGERRSAPITLQANQTVSIVMDYFNGMFSGALVSLNWSSESMTMRLVPHSGSVTPPPASNFTVPYHVSTYNASYPNQDQMLDHIPIYYDNVPEQLTVNPANPGWTSNNGWFSNVPAGNHVFTINSSSSPNYNPNYQTLIKSVDISSDTLIYLTLVKSTTTGDTQTPTFDLQGTIKLKDQNGDYIAGRLIQVNCPDNSDTNEYKACIQKYPTNKSIRSRTKDQVQTTHGSEQNFIIKDIYNINQSFSTFTYYNIIINNEYTSSATSYYYDANGNDIKDANESFNIVVKLNKSDIQPPSGIEPRSFVKKDFVLKKVPPSSTKHTLQGKIVRNYPYGTLSGVHVKVFNKRTAEVLAETISGMTDLVTTNTRFDNYLTEQFQVPASDALVPNYTDIYIEFSKEGFATREVRYMTSSNDPFLQSVNYAVTGTGASAIWVDISDLTLVSANEDLYYKITTNCQDNTLCPNRNATGMIDKIPVVIAGQVEQLSNNNFSPPGVSGKFSLIATSANLEIFVNPSTSPDYQAQYESKTITINSQDGSLLSTGTEFGSDEAAIKLVGISLTANPNYKPQSDQFDLQGLLTDVNGKPVAANVRVSCDNNPACAEKFGPAQHRTSREGENVVETKNGLSENYLFENLYNIARPDSPISQLTLKIDKELHYVDTDNDGTKDDGEDGVITITSDDIRYANGKSFCDKSYVLRHLTDSEVRIDGHVTAKSSGLGIQPAKVQLWEVQTNGTMSDMSATVGPVYTNGEGYYLLSGLKGKVDPQKDYMLVASQIQTTSTTKRYSTQMISVRFTNDSVLRIDFALEENTGNFFVFTGYIQNIDDFGHIQNLSGAEVTASIDGWEISGGNYTDPASLQYKLELSEADIFGGGEGGVAGETKVIQITGFNGKSWEATKHKVYQFTVTRGQGALIRRDFQFYSTDATDILPQTKNVKIFVTKQEKSYQKVSIGSTPALVGKSTPVSYPGVSVQLKSLRSSNIEGQSGYTITSDARLTDANGYVEFSGWPMQETKIIVRPPDSDYIPEGGEAKFVIAATDENPRTINYYKLPWDPNALLNAVGSINMQQGDGRWGGLWLGGGFDNTIGEKGCCLATLSNAIKFYHPDAQFDGSGMNPIVLYNILQNYPGLWGFRSFPALVELVKNKYQLDVKATAISFDSVDAYLRAGIPVMIRTEGLYKPGSDKKHGGHCFLIVGVDNGMYKIINPNWNPSAYSVSKSQMGEIDYIEVLTSTASRGYFRSVQGKVSSRGVALAEDSNTNARTDSDYLVTANIGSDTVAKIQTVYLKLKRPNEQDLFIEMNKDGDNYTYTIPKHLISGNFSYQFVGINTFGAEIESGDYPVVVDQIPPNPAQSISRAYSGLKFNIFNYRNDLQLSLVDVNTFIANAFQSFRSVFSSFIASLGINQSELVSVSGEVVDSSGQRVPKIMVKIWEDVALSENGVFEVKNVKRGRVPIEITNQQTSLAYFLSSPSIDVTNTTSGLRIVVYGSFDDVPPCTPLQPETQTVACPAGSSGSITQTRTSSCPGPTWSQWKETASNCVASPTISKLTPATTFGTATGRFSSHTYKKAWDGSTSSYFSSSSSSGYTGADLGTDTKKITTRIKYWPRNKYASRMKGGKFQGSNTSQTSGFVDLYTINDIPTQGQWSEANLNNTAIYRYIRYLSPAGGYTNVAEIELWGR